MFRFSALITFFSIILTPLHSYSSSADDIKKYGRPLMKTEEEMLLFFEEEEVLVSATLHPQKVSEAPAIATVIKEDEIRNMGARDIVDVLNRVPGIHVTKGYYGKEEIEVRGIKTTNSEKVKFLIDGHSVNNVMTGDATYSFDNLTVDNIKRIEIIRGPGSALYGSNAFSAVINVITKDGKDIDGVTVLAGGGSFNTSKFNLQAGNKSDDFEFALSMDYFSTEGDELKIESDILKASGETRDYEEKYDVVLKLNYKDFSFNSKYVSRRRGVYLGVAYALNDESEMDVKQFFGELSYKHKINRGKITTKLYIDEWHWETKWELYPEGTTLSTGLFPEGMIAIPSIKAKTHGGELQFDYNFFDINLLTVGGLWEKKESYDLGYLANYHPIFWTPDPSGIVSDVNSTGSWNQEKKRELWAAYIQDVWNIRNNINITLGVRRDHYSDFGKTTNPRAALVWGFAETWNFKLLYGTAFRAPSFEELYNINNPSVLGNPELDPEKMTTYEASLVHSYKDNSSTSITFFNNRFRDKIQLIAQSTPGLFIFENSGGAEVRGIEVEWKLSLSKNLTTYLNYTYQDAENTETDRKLEGIPYNKGNIGANMMMGNYIQINPNIFVSDERPRETTDLRDPLPAYALVDLTLIAKNFIKNFEVRTSFHNLLNKKYDDPAPVGDDPANPIVPSDFPRERFNFVLDILYKF